MNIRKVILATGEIYHVFNRSIENRTIFTGKKECYRALETLNYYQYSNVPVRYSHFISLNQHRKDDVLSSLTGKDVTILAFCLMPNHYHLLLRQEKDKGISKFMANFSNSFSKYYNLKADRSGVLFQGVFKAVRIETEEQLNHVSRYIHLNPVTSFIIEAELLDKYEWSSLPEYLNLTTRRISEPNLILSQYKNRNAYRNFVHDQIKYARELDKIKHLLYE